MNLRNYSPGNRSDDLELLPEISDLIARPADAREYETSKKDHAYVQWVQATLNKISRLDVDGIMGPKTRNAVKNFQLLKGLNVDGIVGSQTESALIKAGGTRPPTTLPASAGAFPSSTGSTDNLRNQMVAVAMQEWNRWNQGKAKETNPGVQAILKDYWTTGAETVYGYNNNLAWSAAFISWVVKKAGGGSDFKYTGAHTTYTYFAKQNRVAGNSNRFKAYRTNEVKPEAGDIIVRNRGTSRFTYENVQPDKPGTHGDIVLKVNERSVEVIGGNVSDSVSKSTYPLRPDGYLDSPNHFAIIKINESVSSGPMPTAVPSSTFAGSPLTGSSTIKQGTPADWTKVSEEQRILYVMSMLVKGYNLPVVAASALVGNLFEESALIPNRVEGSRHPSAPMIAPSMSVSAGIVPLSALDIMNRSESKKIGPKLPGIGLAQWTHPARRAGLFNHEFMGARLGPNIIFDMNAQVDYLVKELRTTHKRVLKVITTPGISLNDATDEVTYNFESPGSVANKNTPRAQTAVARRRASAQRAQQLYKRAHGLP